jgi:hypothetical protein
LGGFDVYETERAGVRGMAPARAYQDFFGQVIDRDIIGA